MVGTHHWGRGSLRAVRAYHVGTYHGRGVGYHVGAYLGRNRGYNSCTRYLYHYTLRLCVDAQVLPMVPPHISDIDLEMNSSLVNLSLVLLFFLL